MASCIDKKLQYWSSLEFNAAGRETVANGILISALLYFLAIWGGTKQGIQKVTGKIRNFLWSGSPTAVRARVAWTVCCQPKQVDGLNLIDPQEAVTALIAKWVLTALEPGESNFKVLLRFRLGLFSLMPAVPGPLLLNGAMS
jgi:hypothetical protein